MSASGDGYDTQQTSRLTIAPYRIYTLSKTSNGKGSKTIKITRLA